MRWTRAVLRRRHATCGRQRRVVLSPRRWGQVRGDDPLATETRKPGLRGERAISRKPLRREGRSCRLPCTVLWAFSFQPTRPAGAASARSSLRPPALLEGHGLPPSLSRASAGQAHHPGEISRGTAEACLNPFVIPGRRLSVEPGIHTPSWWLWIPGSLVSLAPRNDEKWLFDIHIRRQPHHGLPSAATNAAAFAIASALAAWLPGTSWRFSPGSSKSCVAPG